MRRILATVELIAFVICTVAILVGIFEVARSLIKKEWSDAAIAFVIVSVIAIARRSLRFNWQRALDEIKRRA